MKNIVIEKSIKVQKENFYESPFDNVYEFKDGVAVVEKDGKYGAIKEDGTVVVELEYDGYLHDFEGGIAIFYKIAFGFLGHEVLVDKTGRIIKKIPYGKSCDPFYNNLLAKIHGYNKTGLINRDGNYVIKPQSKYYICDVYKDIAVMQKYSDIFKRYIVDKNGNMHKFFDYYKVKIVGKNLISVNTYKERFLTDIHNDRISRDYDRIRIFSCFGVDVAIAELNGMTFVIDDLGNEKVLPDAFPILTYDEKEKIIAKIINIDCKDKDLASNSLNIYANYYKNIVEQCSLDGYKVPKLSISGDTAVIDRKYVCKTKDLKLKYVLTIHKFDNETVVKEFDSKDECDAYYDEIVEQVEDYNMNVQYGINKVYNDANNSLDEFLGSSKIKK